MSLDFPNPTGQTPANTFSPTSTPSSSTNGITYTWDGSKWNAAGTGGGGSGGGGSGGATGGGQDYIFQENGQTVRSDYIVGTTLSNQTGSGVTTNTCNALSAGPVTINNGVTVEIENGSNWVVL